MPYSKPFILTEKLGNNAFAWEYRERKYGKTPTLSIPSLINGDISEVQIGDSIVFEEIENGELRSCNGLRNFVHISKELSHHPAILLSYYPTIPPSYYPTILPITIFDNHNHALYFWIDGLRRGILQKGFELIHIDEHSDLWDNEHDIDLDKAIENESYAWEFTNLSCNVGNYIQPALRAGLVGNMIRIENEYQIDAYMDYLPGKNTVLNIDLDIFAPELDHIDEQKKVQIIQNLLKKCSFVTIATSPYFIDQGVAIEKLNEIF